MAPKRNKSEVVSVRFTPEELDALRVLAAGQGLSTYLREKALAPLGRRCQGCGGADPRLIGHHMGVVKFSSNPNAMSFTGNSNTPAPEFLWLCRDCCTKRFGVWAA